MLQRLFTLCLLISSFGITSCDITDNEVGPETGFTQIYDDRSHTTSYDPMAVVQTEDEGYLTLAARDTWKVYLLKADATGRYEWEVHTDEAYVHPLPQFIQIEDQYYFVCMNETTSSTVIMQVDPASRATSVVAELDDIQYPLAVSQNADNSLLILGYDRKSRSSTLHVLNPDFTNRWTNRYAVEEDVEEIIIRHVARTGSRLPFSVGTTTDEQTYYFNGFANYTLGLNFVSSQTGELTGTVNGFRDDEFISAAYPLENNMYALARRSYGVTTLLPYQALDPRTVVSSGGWAPNNFPEIDDKAQVIIKKIMHHQRPVVIFGTNTKERRLVFYAYDAQSGELIGTLYLGQTNPYRMGEFIATRDGGLAVLAETFVAGRFSRPCLFKLTPAEVDTFLQ